MQSKSKPFDDISNLMTNALGAVKGVGDEVKAMSKARAESFVADMDLVGREEFEVFKAIVTKQAAKIERLEAEIAALKKPARKTRARKATTPKKSTSKPTKTSAKKAK